MSEESLKWPIVFPADTFVDAATNNKLFHVDFLKETFRDFARSNLYVVQISVIEEIMSGLSFMGTKNKTKIEMLAKTANIPNFEIGRLDIKRMGQRLYLPASQNYGDLQFTMLSDDYYSQRKFLHSWMKHMVYDSDRNTYSPTSYLANSTIKVLELDNRFNVVFGVELTHVWPSSIGEIQLSQDSENQLVEFPVVFAYSQYKILSPEEETYTRY